MMETRIEVIHWLVFLNLAMVSLTASPSITAPLASSEMTHEDVKPAEVSQELQEKEVKKSQLEDGWSEWGLWSGCSRSCNGGVTYQLRQCQRNSGCDGEAAKYRICNMQACPDVQDFRASQCSAYNSVPYRGRMYEWLPYQDPEDPCSLTCHARSFSFVAKLASAVRDGTRCREGSLDMCVNGKCLAVGCDLQLGSMKKVDECGLCGGDGSTCRRRVYLWSKTPLSPCSVSCGGGYQMSRPTCLNKATEKEVDERLCDVSSRPRPQIKECNTEKCPPLWVTDSWSPCSASCGGGRQARQVHCAQMGTDGFRTPVSSDLCLRQKPLTERPCNLLPCPQWVTGPWSGCSVTCGKGKKSRSSACQDAKGHHSEDCDVENMPATRQDCDSELICTPSEDPGTYLFSDIFKGSGSQEDAPSPSPYYSLPWTQKLKESQSASPEPSYVAGDWGPCSVTCGQGIRNRKVQCQIFLEFSRTYAKLPDKQCVGVRPDDFENCFPRPCSLDQNKPGKGVGIEVTYTWRMGGFTPCSASCLGGIQESIVQCIRDHDQAIASPILCDLRKKPESTTQTCNDHPCLPRWSVSEYSKCSKHCGGGIKTREVKCLHELTRGAANTLVVNNSLCPQPSPRNKEFCNIYDCPARWKTEAWTKCSESCGGGVMTRKIRCTMMKSFGQIEERQPSDCVKRRPKTEKPCNTKPCPYPDSANGGQVTPPSQHTYVQQHSLRRVFLKVGGSAIVFAGTNLKIRCPNRNSNKANALWLKDDEKILPSRKMKISMKGALRIKKVTLKDSGKYTCISGNSRADLHITVESLPSHGRSEGDRTVEKPTDTKDVKFKSKTSEEEFSHEKYHKYNEKNKNHQPKYNPGGQEGNQKSNTLNNFNNGLKNRDYSEEKKPFDRGNKVRVQDDRINAIDRPQVDVPSNTGNVPGRNSDFNTLHRIPLYIQAREDNKSPTTSSPQDNVPDRFFNMIPKTTDSSELFNNGWNQDVNKVPKPNAKIPNEDRLVTPSTPQIVDSWEQKYDGTARKAPTYNKPYDFSERNEGGALFSDQQSGELNIGTPHGGNGGFPSLDNKQSATSGASSSHGGSHIQQLLVNLHNTLGGARERIYNAHDNEDRNEEDEEEGLTNPSKIPSNSFILGRGNADNLEFEWVITEWSPCSQSCGGSGFQVRARQCLVRLNNVSKTVDSNLCEDAGLAPPVTVQNCGSQDCPHWETGTWSLCLEIHCFTWHSSYQKRDVFCRTSDGADVPLFHCEEKTRPRRKRECYNEKCRSTWKVGEWSECTASCGRPGFQSRILQCVWFGSTKPAGNACRDQPRPSVMQPCTGLPCPAKGDCTDRSSHCNLARILNLCHLNHYNAQCCSSCRETKP